MVSMIVLMIVILLILLLAVTTLVLASVFNIFPYIIIIISIWTSAALMSIIAVVGTIFPDVVLIWMHSVDCDTCCLGSFWMLFFLSYYLLSSLTSLLFLFYLFSFSASVFCWNMLLQAHIILYVSSISLYSYLCCD